MSMKQAAEALGMEPAMLAYHLAAKVGPWNRASYASLQSCC